MAKRPPANYPKPDLNTYFLARQSRLFRPGAELILATAKIPKSVKQPARRKAK